MFERGSTGQNRKWLEMSDPKHKELQGCKMDEVLPPKEGFQESVVKRMMMAEWVRYLAYLDAHRERIEKQWR